MSECLHKTLNFGSGDYYIFCRDCRFCWRIEDDHNDNQGKAAELSGEDRIAITPEVERLTDDVRLIEIIHGWLDTWKIELKDNEPFYDLLWRIKGQSSVCEVKDE